MQLTEAEMESLEELHASSVETNSQKYNRKYRAETETKFDLDRAEMEVLFAF